MGSRTIARSGSGSDRWFEIKTRIHHKLLNSLNPDQLRTLNKESVRAQIGSVVERLVGDEGIPMTLAERERVIEEILDEVFGLGPLEPLLKDPTISDIMVNGFDNVYVERAGRVVETNIRFKDSAHVRLIIERIVSAIGKFLCARLRRASYRWLWNGILQEAGDRGSWGTGSECPGNT